MLCTQFQTLYLLKCHHPDIRFIHFLLDAANQFKQAALPEQSKIGKAFLVILFDNQLDRTIKIVPSRSSRGKYFIEPRGYLMVNITIDSHDPLEPITFKALDQELSVDVLLNNTAAIKLNPSTDHNIIHNISVTPQGKINSFIMFLQRQLQNISKESASCDISFSLSFSLSFCSSAGLWKHRYPAFRFALNNLFLSHNNESVRNGAIKAILIVFIPWNECVFV